jgi:hypothetical protein
MMNLHKREGKVNGVCPLSPEFEWRSGQIRFAPLGHEGGTREWSIVLCGDWAPILGQLSAIVENPAGFYGDLLPILRDSQLAVFNLEGVLTDQNLTPIVKDGELIRLPTNSIAGLSIVPFHLACLANNHIFDYGHEGLRQTLKLLQQHDIQAVGAGLGPQQAEEARIFEFGETRLAILNVAEGEEAKSVNERGGVASLNLLHLQERLSSLRPEVDILVVVLHAGREYLPVPAPYVRSFCHALVDAGANLVVGHHPHVPQGIEIYNGTPIAYSLGNFAFFMDTSVDYHQLGYFIKARFQGARFKALEIWPYRIELNGLTLLTGDQRESFLAALSELSALAADDQRSEDIWNAYADSWLTSLGVQEMAENVAMLGNGALMTASTLRATLGRYNENRFTHRLARRALWLGINWLDQRARSQQSLAELGKSDRARRGAAILRNRFDTQAHRRLYLTALRRVMDGMVGQAPDWAYRLLNDWQVFW